MYETRCRHRDGHRVFHRKQRAGSACESHAGRSGISRADKYAELGFRSQVHGAPTLKAEEVIDRRAMRFHGGGTAWNHVAMDQAIRDSGLEPKEVSHERTGLIMGSGGPSTRASSRPADITRSKGPKRVGPYAVPEVDVLDGFSDIVDLVQDQGRKLLNLIGLRHLEPLCWSRLRAHLERQARCGLAGGCEDLDWTLSVLFDAMGAMSSRFNETPERASRAYDRNCDGFVISAGAGVLVLEDHERAKARGARIYGEVAGYGATSDGVDMVAPSGEGAARCMRQALATLRAPIDYINPHATSTPVGDLKGDGSSAGAIWVGEKCPPISATKSLTGHSQGATGVHEVIYSI